MKKMKFKYTRKDTRYNSTLNYQFKKNSTNTLLKNLSLKVNNLFERIKENIMSQEELYNNFVLPEKLRII